MTPGATTSTPTARLALARPTLATLLAFHAAGAHGFLRATVLREADRVASARLGRRAA